MAVKKAATPKTDTKSKTATPKKAAPAPKKADTKKTTKKADATVKAPAKKAPAKKAAPVKLTDAQGRVLAVVHQAGETGYAGSKAEGKVLESLLKKKLVKRGKKVDGAARYLVTKAGAKHVVAPSTPPAPPSPAPEAMAPAPSPSA